MEIFSQKGARIERKMEILEQKGEKKPAGGTSGHGDGKDGKLEGNFPKMKSEEWDDAVNRAARNEEDGERKRAAFLGAARLL